MTKVRLALFVLPALVVSVSAADVSGTWMMRSRRTGRASLTLFARVLRKAKNCRGVVRQRVNLTGGQWN
jgi:hypothetical protein